ncbi:MAG: TrpR-related protein YerC/YecD [Oscillospiraceae bacterium]|nr:TrpR-related protein YerC/YecD [Oscillospiraceae bacterium]
MKLQSETMNQLFDAILNLENREECYAFFEDLCTIKELQDMAQRLQVAQMLYDGCSYQTIAEAAETSTATIGRVSRCLNYGSGGYRTMLGRMKKEDGQG